MISLAKARKTAVRKKEENMTLALYGICFKVFWIMLGVSDSPAVMGIFEY